MSACLPSSAALASLNHSYFLSISAGSNCCCATSTEREVNQLERFNIPRPNPKAIALNPTTNTVNIALITDALLSRRQCAAARVILLELIPLRVALQPLQIQTLALFP